MVTSQHDAITIHPVLLIAMVVMIEDNAHFVRLGIGNGKEHAWQRFMLSLHKARLLDIVECPRVGCSGLIQPALADRILGSGGATIQVIFVLDDGKADEIRSCSSNIGGYGTRDKFWQGESWSLRFHLGDHIGDRCVLPEGGASRGTSGQNGSKNDDHPKDWKRGVILPGCHFCDGDVPFVWM